MLTSETLHATTVSIDGVGIMICGLSGSGKSDLALRLIDRGAVLVSDDYTILTKSDEKLLASAPSTIRGKIEMRGVGLVDKKFVENVPVKLIVELGGTVPRLPDERKTRNILGVFLPVVPLSPFEHTTPIKVEHALKALTD